MHRWLGPGLAVIFISGMGAAAQAQPAGQDERREPPSLLATGHAQVSATPDQAVVRLGAVAQARQASEAQRQVNEVMRRAIEAIRGLGVPDRHISTTGLSLSPVYTDPQPRPRPERGQEEPSEPRIVGYRASNTVRVQLDDIQKVGDVIDAGVQAGANHIEDLSFQLRDDTEARQRALREAVREARAKAETLADAMDVQLVRVLEVQEGGISIMQPRYGGRQIAYAAAEMATPVQPGQVQVDASVTVRYEIDQTARSVERERPRVRPAERPIERPQD